MKKLTAGIFAGILTIVTVNAANAAITSKAYVDGLYNPLKETVDTNTGAITTLTTTVGDADSGLVKDVAKLQTDISSLTGGNGSIASQIADALGDLGEDTTVKAELDKKQDKSSAAYSMGGENGAWTVMTQAQQDALNSEITKADVAQINTNKSDIATISDKIGEIDEGKTVVGLIDEVKTAASGDVDEKLGDLGDGNNTVADALAKKQDTLGATNVTTTGSGNVVSAVTADNGVVTVTKTNVIPAVTTTGQTGTFVLTATVTADGVANYMWESIERAATATTEE
ncbi:MAG: hypothetical protein K2M34_00640 [Alphaproteobacteria bacterium]|nr:hypothetical protein [Alphaproteobacteria bacterium]